MKTTLHTQINQNPEALAALDIIMIIQDHGALAYLVGGGVRDMLLGRPPGDIDVATSATPEQLQTWFPHSVLVGAKFGVLIIPVNGISIEVATFREEGEYNDRRRPDLVKFSNITNDARRRDFTCNALYYDPVSNDIVDQVDGIADIKARVLRTVGSAIDRFSEDALRVLRAVRFAANLGFTIHPDTWHALISCAPYLNEISIERVRDELLKGFCGQNPARFLDLLDETGILEMFIPELLQLKGCKQPPEFHPEGDVFVHTRLMLTLLSPDPPPCLVMAVLLHDIAKPATQTFEDRIRFNGHDTAGAIMAEQICSRLKMSTSQIDCIGKLVRRHMQFINIPFMRKSTLHKFLASEYIESELELHRVDCLASNGNLTTYNLSRQALETFRSSQPDGTLPPPLITGKELIDKGLRPGPSFSEILKQTYDAQLDDQFTTLEEALDYALSFATSITAPKPK